MDEVDKFARVIKTANPDFWVSNAEKFVMVFPEITQYSEVGTV